MFGTSRVIVVVLVAALLAICVGCGGGTDTDSTDQVGGGRQDISWERAVELVQQGSVIAVSQTHDRRVYMMLADGTEYRTTEPQIDAIFAVVDAAPNREDIVLSTE